MRPFVPDTTSLRRERQIDKNKIYMPQMYTFPMLYFLRMSKSGNTRSGGEDLECNPPFTMDTYGIFT